ncbi:DUF4149 domain-containing protein [Haloferula rosea]|uniref:DUF4149 domain-containing protein n=1 Tax=Haloferula rosea TaxID=490093 RepID=A0A934RCR1_9BACT|nr:DUF4149 domain-containing protein [Haloferula rosea]MBK1826884.1 hypothetical protein [Haloferula rosea]
MSPFARFLSVIIATIIVFQSAVVAPAINVALPVEPAAVLLRFIWPVFFSLIGILGLVGVVATRKQRAALLVNGATVLSMATCYFMVPVINAAMDQDNLGLWKALHILTVGLTFLCLILHLVYTFRWHKRA